MKMNYLLLVLALLLARSGFGAGNGELQLHFIDVGQGDAELLVSPGGQTVLVDGGLPGTDKTVKPYLAKHGFTNLDYYIISYYHKDHLGSISKILTQPVVSHLQAAFDRGDSPANTDSFTSTYTKKYKATVDGKRVTGQTTGSSAGHRFKLDAGSNQPVEIEFIAVNGNGQVTKTTINENDLSVAFVVRFGKFSAVLGGDLSGSNGSKYTDIETSLATSFPKPVTVYKVHHHGSRYSSNTNWLRAINPVVGIICCGTKNGYGLPMDEALNRLADFKVDTYWTETGGKKSDAPNGAAHLVYVERPPNKSRHQKVGGDIVVQVAANGDTFELNTASPQHTYVYSLGKPSGSWGVIVSGGP
jgi:beta-lactamase superfamily II metal-dependent hydrolase